MKKALFTVAAVAALGVYANAASAQCDFNEPGKAKGVKASFVRAYAVCGGITFPAPNDQSDTGTPTCSDPFPISAFKFDEEKGKCDFKATHKVENPCSTGTPTACSNLSLSLKCSGVLNADGVTPNSSSGWNFNTLARVTFDDAAGGDMTVIDFPAQFPLPTADGGKLSGKFTTNELLTDLFGAGSELPACSAVQLIRVAIADPTGNTFAVLGTSGR